MAILEVQHVSKSFGHTEVLKDISFSLEKGKVLSLIGSSGSGKTTLLRCLNFLERPDGGVIRVNGETLFDAGDRATMQESEIRRKRLHCGLVFQSFNLFPQYTALQNVMLAKELLEKEKPDYKARKKEIHAQIEAEARTLLDQMGLSDRVDNYPHQLSGGQCQRVAIARALALKPDILCFDEPTSALDPELTGEVLKVIKGLADQETTMIIVTHEMAFARDVSSQVIFMDGGCIMEQGTPAEVFGNPKTPILTQDLNYFISEGKWTELEFGAIRMKIGTYIFLKADGYLVTDYLDTEAPLWTGDSKFVFTNPSGTNTECVASVRAAKE